MPVLDIPTLEGCVYLDVITRQFSYRPVYQSRASIISPRRMLRADDDRDLDIRVDMKTPCDDLFIIRSILYIDREILQNYAESLKVIY